MAGIADLDLPESDEDLLALVFRDDLTGLLNRRFFARFMKQVADWSDGAPPVALAMMDMDNLKRINDRLGHMSGDATLKRLGELFKDEIKDGQYAVRYAGDEFALILPGSTRKDALELANRLRQVVVKDTYKDAKLPEGLRPSLSIGVACFPDDAPAGGDELTEAADRALYYSKRTGKNRVTSAADIVDAEEVSDLEALSGFPSRSLVGRKAAFETADEAISLVLDDHFAFVLVEGEAGTGKTRLLGEYARYAQERDLAVLIERCTPVSRDDPYRVLGNLLERYLRANPAIRDRCLSELSPAQRSALREVLPSLPADRRRPPAGATPPTSSRRPTGRRPRRGGPVQVRRQTGSMRRPPAGRRSRHMRRPSESGRLSPRPNPNSASGRLSARRPESERVRREGTDSQRLQRGESERVQRPRDPAELTVSLFTGMLELLKALGRAQPLVILLDNLEHADEPTLEVMRRSLEHEGKVLFVGAARPPINPDDESDPFRAFCDALSEHGAGAFRLTLGPLSPEEARELSTNLLEGYPPPLALSDRLQELTKGNPLFVEGILRHLIETKILSRTSDGWTFQGVIPDTVPVTLEEVLRQQLQVLDEGTATFLRDAAVVGPNFEIDVLRKTGGDERSEGETLDLVGDAVRTKILRETGDVDGPELEFASEAIQLETYDSLDEAQRKDVHRRVAEAVGDTPKAPAIKAYHFGRAGDAQKRDRFLAQVRARKDQIFDREAIESLPSGKPPLIPEVTEAAPQTLLELLPKFAKALATSAKVVRLYPDRSKVVAENLGNLCGALASAWALTPAFTISHRGNAWTLNGAKLKRDVGEGQHHESVVAKLFRGNSIKSLTFVRPGEENDLAAELRDFLEETGKHSVQTPVGRHHWDGFARTRKLRSLGIVQKTFVLKNRPKGGDSRPMEAKRLAEANLPLIKDLVRHLMAAIDSIRKYPPGSKVSNENLANLDRSLRRLFDLVPALAIHEGEDGAIVVNGTQLIANALPAGGAELYTLLHDGKLKGIVILNEVTPRELARFVARIAKLNPADFAGGADPLAEITSDGSFPNVVVGDALYQLAQAVVGKPQQAETADSKPEKPEPEAEPRGSEDDPIGEPGPDGFRWPSDATALVAWDLCALEPQELLRSPHNESFVETLDRLLLDERLNLATRLIERLALCFATEDSDDRLRAGEQFLQLAKRGSQELRGRYFQVASRRLGDALELEASTEAFEVLCECTRIGLIDRLASGDWDVAARLVWALKRRRQRRAEGSAELKRAATKTLEQVLGDPRIDRVLETIENGSQQERRRAARVLEGMGTLAVDAIVQALKTTGRSRVEAFLIDMLAALAPDSESALRKAVTPFAPPASTRRLMRAGAVVCQNPAAVLITGLQNPDHSVQVEAVNVARSVGGPVASRVLRWALADGSVPAQITAVKQLGELARGEAFSELLDLLQRADTVELQRECCLALGKLRLDGQQTARVVTALTNFVRPASFLRSEYHEDVRAAAAWSLGQMKSHEGARRALERVLEDKDKRVRLTARLSLRGKQT